MPLLPHLDHALGFGTAALGADGRSATGVALDLGSGAGLPGLPLALAWPESQWTLVDAGDPAGGVPGRGGAGARARATGSTVVEGRAEELGHDVRLRGRFDLVVARGFGPPAVTAECAAGFLAVGGVLVVSEPPGGRPDRWPAAGLAPLGLEPETTFATGGASYQVLRQREPCPDRFPRRPGIPAKRPLFASG